MISHKNGNMFAGALVEISKSNKPKSMSQHFSITCVKLIYVQKLIKTE